MPTTLDSLVIERTRCYGTCPAYRLRLGGAGDIVFASRNPGEEGVTAADSVAPSAVRALIVRAESIGFFALPDSIDRGSSLCGSWATDHPTVTVTVFQPTRRKRVVDYWGCYTAVDHSLSAPLDALRRFESAIDSVAGTRRWARPARRR